MGQTFLTNSSISSWNACLENSWQMDWMRSEPFFGSRSASPPLLVEKMEYMSEYSGVGSLKLALGPPARFPIAEASTHKGDSGAFSAQNKNLIETLIVPHPTVCFEINQK